MDSDSSFPRFLTSSQEEDLEDLMMSEGIIGLNNQGVMMTSDFAVTSAEQDVKPYNVAFGLSCMDEAGAAAEARWSVPATIALPSTERYEGAAGFGLNLHGQQEGKSWIFSIALNKVFINVGNKFPVQFVWKRGSVVRPRVRALMVFMAHDSLEEAVERCNHHALSSDKSNANFRHDVRHVMRTENEFAEYWTDPVSERHSLVVPLQDPQAGTCGTTVLYSFVCKNSCPSGMNRRPTQVVFTLEDPSGQVYGREAMPVRICSCPKRDKDKEEGDIVKTVMSQTKSLKRPKAGEESDAKRQRVSEPFQEESDEEIRSAIAVTACVVLSLRASRQKREMTPAEKEKYERYANMNRSD